MAGSSAGALREVVAFFGLDFDKNSFKDVDSKIGGLRNQVVGLARVFTTGLIANEFRKLITETARLGDNVQKTASKLGIGTQALQELRHAASLSGVQQNTLDMAMQRFIRRSAEAAKGTGEAKDALRELGVQLTDSTGKLRPPEELLGDVAEAMKRTGNDGDRLRLAFKLFDSEGVAMVNMLRDGKGGLEAMRKEAEELGLVMSDELIASSVEYEDTMTRFHGVVQGVKNLITQELLPGIIGSTKGLIAFVRENRELISGAVVAGFRFFARLFVGIKDALMSAGRAVVGFGQRLGDGTRTVLVFAGVMGLLVGIFGAKYLLITLIIALLEDLFRFFRGENSLLGEFSKWFSQLQEDLENSPIDVDDTWPVRVAKTIAHWIKTAREFWADLIGDLAFSDSAVGRTVGALLGIRGSASGQGALGEALDFWFGRSERSSQAPPPFTAGPGQLASTGANQRVPASRSGDINSTAVQVNQTINAAPGQSEEAIGNAAAKKVREELGTALRQAQRAKLPRAAQ